MTVVGYLNQRRAYAPHTVINHYARGAHIDCCRHAARNMGVGHTREHGSKLHSSAKHALPVDIPPGMHVYRVVPPCSHKADSGVALLGRIHRAHEHSGVVALSVDSQADIRIVDKLVLMQQIGCVDTRLDKSVGTAHHSLDRDRTQQSYRHFEERQPAVGGRILTHLHVESHVKRQAVVVISIAANASVRRHCSRMRGEQRGEHIGED